MQVVIFTNHNNLGRRLFILCAFNLKYGLHVAYIKLQLGFISVEMCILCKVLIINSIFLESFANIASDSRSQLSSIYYVVAGHKYENASYFVSKQLISYPLSASVYCKGYRAPLPKSYCAFATLATVPALRADLLSFCVSLCVKCWAKGNKLKCLVFRFRRTFGILCVDLYEKKQSDESHKGRAWREWRSNFHDWLRW